MNLDMFPSPNLIISTMCRKKESNDVVELFDERKREMEEYQKLAPANILVQPDDPEKRLVKLYLNLAGRS